MQVIGRSWPRRHCWCQCGTTTWAQLMTSSVSSNTGCWGVGGLTSLCWLLTHPSAGGVTLSSRANGERLRHWRECLSRSDRRLELWHLLDSVPPQLGD